VLVYLVCHHPVVAAGGAPCDKARPVTGGGKVNRFVFKGASPGTGVGCP
jgi:hypothetical protein